MRCFLSFSLVLASAAASLCQTVPVAAQEVFPAEKLILATNRVRSSGPQTTAAFKARQTGPLTFFLVQPVAPSTTIRTTPLARESLSQRLAEKAGRARCWSTSTASTTPSTALSGLLPMWRPR